MFPRAQEHLEPRNCYLGNTEPHKHRREVDTRAHTHTCMWPCIYSSLHALYAECSTPGSISSVSTAPLTSTTATSSRFFFSHSTDTYTSCLQSVWSSISVFKAHTMMLPFTLLPGRLERSCTIRDRTDCIHGTNTCLWIGTVPFGLSKGRRRRGTGVGGWLALYTVLLLQSCWEPCQLQQSFVISTSERVHLPSAGRFGAISLLVGIGGALEVHTPFPTQTRGSRQIHDSWSSYAYIFLQIIRMCSFIAEELCSVAVSGMFLLDWVPNWCREGGYRLSCGSRTPTGTATQTWPCSSL